MYKKSLWGINIISLLWSMASLMVFSMLPVFMKEELHISHTQIGLIEGFAISCAFLSKFFAGILSDLFRNRKPLIVLGTLLNVATKFCFFLATNAFHVFFARFFDRMSKGIRSSPADALVADLSKTKDYAKNFGVRQAFTSFGGVLGAAISFLIFFYLPKNYKLLFGLSLVPAMLAIFIALFLINPPKKSHPRHHARFDNQKISLKDIKKFPFKFWWLMFALFLLMMARFSEAFLVLKVKDVGLLLAYLPLLTVLMDLTNSLVSYPSGKYADKFSRFSMMINSLLVFMLADIVMFFSSTILGVTLGLMIIGVHMGISQGVMRALIAEITPPELRGTAFSLFFVISGFAIFLGNAIAGFFADRYGISYTFVGGGIFAFLSFLAFLLPKVPVYFTKLRYNFQF